MVVLDLGSMGFERGAHLLVKRALRELPSGGHLRVVGTDPALSVHLRAWARAQGHALDGTRQIREWIEAGAIGDLLNLRSTFCTNSGRPLSTRTPESNWRFNKAKGGGSIYDLACYNIHHARFVFGEEPVRVFAAQELGIEADDAASMVLVFSGGRSAQISVGFNSFSSQYAEISGHEGILRLDKVWNNENQPVAIEYQSQEGVEVIEFEPCFQFALQLQHLCACLSTGQPHRIPAEHSIAQMRVLDAVKESMETGVAVDL